MRLASLWTDQKANFFLGRVNQADLVALREQLEKGKVRPVVERGYALGETAEALAYVGQGHARGKIVITI